MRSRPENCSQSLLANRAKGSAGPSVAPFWAHGGAETKRRSVASEAAACFFATALGSLSPQALSLLDLTPTRQPTVSASAETSKFTDRVLIGGLRSISWEDAPVTAPAFTTVQAVPGPAVRDEAPARPSSAPVRAAARKAEKSAETKIVDQVAATRAPESEATPPAATREPRPEATEQGGALSALTPSTVSSKLAPIGQMVAGGARTVGSAVAGGLSWLGY